MQASRLTVKVAVPFSGGKDSTYALYVAQQRGWDITSLVTIIPLDPHALLFHTPNIRLTPLMADCLGIPLIARESGNGEALELEALKSALDGLDVEAIVLGTIVSDYQKSRVDSICDELGLRCFTPLWRLDQATLLDDYLTAGFRILMTGVAAEGLDESWLGREMDRAMQEELIALNKKYGLSICGEGGEFETLVVDGPNFEKRLRIVEADSEFKGSSGVYRVIKAEVERK